MTPPVASFSLLAPVSGVLVPLDDVPDPVFAQRLAGDGVSIDPIASRILAPADGRVIQMHRAGHAVTLEIEGLEVIIHIGLDTVTLGGRGFRALVAAGDRVRAGDSLIEFDADAVARDARSLLTQMVIANMDRVASVDARSGMVVAGRDPVMRVTFVASGATPAIPIAEPSRELIEGDPVIIRAETGLHARPASLIVAEARRFTADLRIVKGAREANARSVVSIMALEVAGGDLVRVTGRGADARQGVEALAALLASLEDGHADAAPSAAARQEGPVAVATTSVPVTDGIYRGVAASPGVAVGAVYLLEHDDLVVEEHAADPNRERRALDAAIAAAHLQLEALQGRLASEVDADNAAIFAAHQEILEDPDVLDRAAELIRDGASAAHAWRTAYLAQAERLRGLATPLLAARATDLRDVGRRVLHLLVGEVTSGSDIPPDSILIAEDLTPSDTASLDRTRVRGICTTMGSATSHVAILARGLGIPAVAGIDARVLQLTPGTRVILDGDAGTLATGPSAAQEAAIASRRAANDERRRTELAAAHEPAITRDGHRVEVVANLGDAAEAARVPGMGGEGVGLLRSEFVFMERRTAPSEDDQAATYSDIARALGRDRILVIRTLDVGGDKPLSYVPMAAEANPFLGERGIRMTLARPELFRAQVRAILRASTAGKVAVMFPMIATLAEWQEARALVERERATLGVPAIQVGIMVETAAAALMAEHFAREADFLSIGTNDLTQYTLAMDRTNPRLAPQVDALHPAVLKLIAMTVEGGHAHGRWVGVCGAMAGDPLAIPVLLGLGVDELSADLPLVPSVKARVRALSLENCRNTARDALRAADGTQVRSLVEQRHG